MGIGVKLDSSTLSINSFNNKYDSLVLMRNSKPSDKLKTVKIPLKHIIKANSNT